jgi:Immunoglobulin I-set domain
MKTANSVFHWKPDNYTIHSAALREINFAVTELEGDAVPPIPSVQPSSGLPSGPDVQPAVGLPITSGSAFEVASVLPKLITPVPLVDPCTIISQQPPQFTMSLHNQVVNDGDRTTFAVQFDGHPKPTVQWYINALPMANGDNLEINIDERLGTSSLTIHSTSAVCEGEYMCKAENAVGTAFTTSHLFVLGELAYFGAYARIFYSNYCRVNEQDFDFE